MGGHEIVVAVLYASSKGSGGLSGLLGQTLNSGNVVLLLGGGKS
jgi:hypothetical protein